MTWFSKIFHFYGSKNEINFDYIILFSLLFAIIFCQSFKISDNRMKRKLTWIELTSIVGKSNTFFSSDIKIY